MSGACYSCATGFSMFKKEYGCKKCGFAFCKNCISHKWTFPELNNEKHRVCTPCYNILSGKKKPPPPRKVSPPEALRKRLAAHNDPAAARPVLPSAGVPQSRPAHDATKYTDPADRNIAERLGKLKEDRAPKTEVPSQKEMEERLAKLKEDLRGPPPPSTSEMQDRLAKLKGQDPATANKPHVFAVDRRLAPQQVDDLLAEICDEVEIDAHHVDPAQDVQSRLDALKGGTSAQPAPAPDRAPAPSLPRGEGEEEGDYQAMQKLVEEVADELALDAERAIRGLQKDKEIWGRLQGLKEGRKEKEKEEKDKDSAAEGEQKTPVAEGVEDSGGKSDRRNSPPLMVADNKEADEEEEEGDEEAAKELIRKLLIENEIEEQENRALIGDTQEADSGQAAEDEEFPWCILCNEDASLQCMGCDGDLYCATCYKKGHDRFELQDHNTKPFKPPKNAKS